MFADQPPLPPPPEIVRTESGYAPAAHRDVPLTLTRGAQSEKALIRYQLFARTDVQASRPAAAEPTVDFTCAWTVTAYLEREPCLESITGRLACAESYTVRLDDRERGEEKMTGDPGTCGLETPAVAAAQARRFLPGLVKSGVTARPRPLR